MDARRALALARSVELVATSVKTAVELYIEDCEHFAELDAELDQSVSRHPAGKGKVRPLRTEED